MKKYLSLALLLIIVQTSYGQSDLVVGSSYQFNIQRQNGYADAFLLHNAQFNSIDPLVLKWTTSHATFGSRGMRFSYTDGIHFFADNQATTANNTFTPATRFFIGNNGNVGIGTTSPSVWFGGNTKVLELAEGRPILKLNSKVSNDLATILFTNSSVNPTTHDGEFHLNYQYDATNASLSALRFSCYPSGELLTIKSNGTVGIGTGNAAPQVRLHVYEPGSSSSTWRGRIVASGQNQAVVMGEFDGKAVLAAHPNTLDSWSDLHMQMGASKLGIGTWSPTQKLEVNGSILQNAENSAFGIDAQSTARLGFIKKSGSWPTIASDVSTPILFSQTNQVGIVTNIAGATVTERMRIEVNGNVGIGTKSPDQKLTVKGKIHAEEVIIDLAVPAPDYVFEKDYSLTPLDTVKAYLAVHKHLPEVPSAKEMEANGVKVGEMEMILLKKVEELTLYVIELKSENEKMREENKELHELQRERLRALESKLKSKDGNQ